MNAMQKRKTILLSLIGLLAVSGCVAPSSEFCTVYDSPITFPGEVAAVVVGGARGEAVKIDTRNRYWEGNCP